MIQIDLTGQVAVITGGSSGIGLATAELFLRAGASVAICGRDATRLEAAEAQLNSQFADAELLAVQCDVLNAQDIEAFATKVSQRFGRAGMLLNNAGQGRVSTFADTTDEAWRDELDLKYFSIIRPTRAVPAHAARRTGAVDRLCEFAARAAARAAYGRDIVGTRRGVEPRQVARHRTRAATHSRQFDPDRHRGIGSMAPPARGAGAGRPELGSMDGRTGAQEKHSAWPLWTSRRSGAGALYLATNLSSYTTGSHIDVSGGFARHV